MRFWISENVTVGIEWLCCLTGHWRGCWVMNRSPLSRVYFWAVDVFYAQMDYTGRHDCPYCGKDQRPRPTDGASWSVRDGSHEAHTGNSGMPITVHIERRDVVGPQP